MKPTRESILADALGLPEEDRAALVHELSRSLQAPEQREIDEAWDREIERRVKEIEEGRVKLVPYREVQRKVREILRAKRNTA